jgi:tetratricopeptide (TPR) repeat protein
MTANVLYNKGTNAYHAGKYEKAIKLLKQSIALDPTKEAFLNLGACYKQLNQLPRALEAFKQSAKIDPKYSLALNNLGLMYHIFNKENEALKYFDEALALDPEYADAGWNRALSLLKRACTGEYELFKDGWENYEWRFHKTNPVTYSKTYSPRWHGENDGTVMVMVEQGIGDSVMFMRYIPFITDHCKVIVQTTKELAPLFSGFEVTHTSETPHDYHVPICSLPAYFNMIPTGTYMHYQGDLREDLAGGIGIVWKGNPGHGNDINRSSAEGFFRRFSKYGKLYSLQYGAKPKYSEALEINNWEDTIKYIASLDAVITIDSSVAHIAGALGKKVFILLPGVDTDFRWGTKGDTTFWYDSATLIRNMNFDEAEKRVAEWRALQGA